MIEPPYCVFSGLDVRRTQHTRKGADWVLETGERFSVSLSRSSPQPYEP